MVLAAMILLAMCVCFFVAWQLQQRYSPEPGSALYIGMRMIYVLGWGFAIILGLFVIAAVKGLLTVSSP